MSTTNTRETFRSLVSAVLARTSSGALRLVEWAGGTVMDRVGSLADIIAVLIASIQLAARPTSWTPAVRLVFSRQLLFTGADAVFFSIRIAGAVGILIIVQAALWIDAVGIGTDLIQPILWRGIVRELAPLIACLVVIGRSGVAMSTELATMVVGGEIELIDAQGVDPMTYLVMPRVLSFVISAFGLALIIAAAMIGTGFVVGQFMGVIRTPWAESFEQSVQQFNSMDVIFFVPKTTIAGGIAGAICCRDGMRVRGTMTDVPLVSSRSAIRALTAVFGVSAILSILIYGRILVFEVL